jgi:hypothetical protein
MVGMVLSKKHLFCSGGNLGFPDETKKKHLLEDHPRNIPSNFTLKECSCFRE